MPSVLSYTNAFPGIPFPNKTSTVTVKPQSFAYPGAVQPDKGSATVVLNYTNALPGGAFPNKTSTVTVKPQSFEYPGAVQPAIVVAAAITLMPQIVT